MNAPLVDEADDFSSLMSDCPDDQHDYMLNREVHRIGVFADQAVSKNPLMEVGQAEKCVVVVFWLSYVALRKIAVLQNKS